jgi:hypothetical protein
VIRILSGDSEKKRGAIKLKSPLKVKMRGGFGDLLRGSRGRIHSVPPNVDGKRLRKRETVTVLILAHKNIPDCVFWARERCNLLLQVEDTGYHLISLSPRLEDAQQSWTPGTVSSYQAEGQRDEL